MINKTNNKMLTAIVILSFIFLVFTGLFLKEIVKRNDLIADRGRIADEYLLIN